MSRWENWSRGEQAQPRFLSSFVKEALDTGNPAVNSSPAERARQLGLQSDGSGSYIDPESGQVVARTVNGELVFYDNRGLSGGAVSDGSGGAEIVKAQPTWSDPITGLAITPPAHPESPFEKGAVPDAIPASAPAGYDSFMNQTKMRMYSAQQQQNATNNVNNPMQAAPAAGINPIQPDGNVDQGPGFDGEPMPGMAEALDVGNNAAMRKRAGLDVPQPPVQPDFPKFRKKLQQKAVAEPQAQAPVEAPQQAQPEAQPERPVLSAIQQKLLTAIQTMNTGGKRLKGAGVNNLSNEDLDKFENYIKNGAQNERVKLSDEDFEWAKGQLDESLGGKRSKIKGFISKLESKGSVPAELKVNDRGSRVLRSYLENLGQSAVDGSPLALSESDLDHHLALAEGGTDDLDNWRWLPTRFNNFKKDFEDDYLLERIQKQREMDPLDETLKFKEQELRNSMRSEWKQEYGQRGWEHLNIADLKELKGGPGMQKIKALANAAGVSTTTMEGVKPGSRTPNRGKSIDELRDEIIEKLGIPEQHDIESWDRGLFETMQRLEDKRSDLQGLNIQKKARDKQRRDDAKAAASVKESLFLEFIERYRANLNT